jgi:hypothetical protein
MFLLQLVADTSRAALKTLNIIFFMTINRERVGGSPGC